MDRLSLGKADCRRDSRSMKKMRLEFGVNHSWRFTMYSNCRHQKCTFSWGSGIGPVIELDLGIHGRVNYVRWPMAYGNLVFSRRAPNTENLHYHGDRGRAGTAGTDAQW